MTTYYVYNMDDNYLGYVKANNYNNTEKVASERFEKGINEIWLSLEKE